MTVSAGAPSTERRREREMKHKRGMYTIWETVVVR